MVSSSPAESSAAGFKIATILCRVNMQTRHGLCKFIAQCIVPPVVLIQASKYHAYHSSCTVQIKANVLHERLQKWNNLIKEIIGMYKTVCDL